MYPQSSPFANRSRIVLLASLFLLLAGCGRETPVRVAGLVETRTIPIFSPVAGEVASLAAEGELLDQGAAVATIQPIVGSFPFGALERPVSQPLVAALESRLRELERDKDAARQRMGEFAPRVSVSAGRLVRESPEESLRRELAEARLLLLDQQASAVQLDLLRAKAVPARSTPEALRAPQASFVAAAMVVPGQVVRPGDVVALLSAAQSRSVVAAVAESRLPLFAKGAAARIAAADGTEGRATVVRQAPEGEFATAREAGSEKETRVVRVWLSLEAGSPAFRPGSRVTVTPVVQP